MADTNTITADAGVAVGVIQTVLPFIELALPQVAAVHGLATAGIAAAQALIPLIQSLHIGGTITAEQQQALLDKVNAIVSGAAFKGPEWQPSTAPAPAHPSTPPYPPSYPPSYPTTLP